MLPKRLLGSAITLIVMAYSIILPAMVILEPQAVRPIHIAKPNTGNNTPTVLATPADSETPQPPAPSLHQTSNQPAEAQTPNPVPAPSAPNNTSASTHYTVNSGTAQAAAAANRQNSPQQSPGTNLSAYQYEMLVRIISAEAKGEPLEGQVAVGAVILNRIKSGKFPDTVAANVLKRGEFEPVANGQIWSQPVQSAYRAAQLALKGWDPTYGALYFYNPAKTTSRWIWNRPTLTRIGDHVFAG